MTLGSGNRGRRAPAAAARRLDDDDLVGGERQARLARLVTNRAVGPHDVIVPGLAVGATLQPVGREAAALALQGHARGVAEAADRADETVAAAVLASAR